MIRYFRRVRSEGRLYLANYWVAFIPSHRVRLWFYRRYMRLTIGPKSSIFMGAWIDTAKGLSIGTCSTVNQKCRLDSRGGITIGDNVSISAEVCILSAEHDIQAADFAGVNEPVIIEDFVFIGTRALILPGVTIGRGAVVAAGAVVTKDVEPYTVVGGVPAKKIGVRTTDLAYEVFYRRLFQ